MKGNWFAEWAKHYNQLEYKATFQCSHRNWNIQTTSLIEKMKACDTIVLIVTLAHKNSARGNCNNSSFVPISFVVVVAFFLFTADFVSTAKFEVFIRNNDNYCVTNTVLKSYLLCYCVWFLFFFLLEWTKIQSILWMWSDTETTNDDNIHCPCVSVCVLCIECVVFCAFLWISIISFDFDSHDIRRLTMAMNESFSYFFLSLFSFSP